MSALRGGNRSVGSRSVRGVTLIELMVALVLGLIVAGAAMAVFITNRQTYIATEGLGRLQEGGRVAFELMSRDLREASMIPCTSEEELRSNSVLQFNNIVNSSQWWNNWSADAVKGGFKGIASGDTTTFATGTGIGERLAGTDALELKSAVPASVDVPVIDEVAAGTQDIPVNSTTGLVAGDILMACDYGYDGDTNGDGIVEATPRGSSVVVFQATSIGTDTIAHGTGTPGNTTSSVLLTGTEPSLQKNGLVSVVRAARWYIGHNRNNGKSLFRSSLRNVDGVPTVVNDEIVANADTLTLSYLESGGTAYVAADSVADWSTVNAVRIQLRMVGTDLVDGAPIERTLEHVVTVRNRAL